MRLQFFKKGDKFGDVELKAPLKVSRMNVLNRRGNSFLSENARDDQGDPRAILEVFYVLSRTSQELTDQFSLTRDEWDELVDRFGIENEDGVDAFADAMEAEFGEDEPGKPAGTSSPTGCEPDLPTPNASPSPLPKSLALFAQDLPQEEATN